MRCIVSVHMISYHTMGNSTWWRNEMETFSTLLALLWGIHWAPVNSPHKGQWHRALMFSLNWAWINSWVNNREAGDLRPHHANYDVTVMRKGIEKRNNISLRKCSPVQGSTHCGLVIPFGDKDLVQHWLRWWLFAWWHQAITYTTVD